MRTALPLLVALAAPAAAEVKSVTETGFSIEDSVLIGAPRGQVYAALGQPATWWNPTHSWSGDAAHMTLDVRPGGCFCERLPKDGGFVEHGRVIFAQPGQMLRLSAALGPLQAEAVSGSLSFKLDPGPFGDTTNLTVTYVVGGYVRGGATKLAPAVDAVIGEQIRRLAASLRK
jgi:uncharacterized protein YndB with AHSA1/START domain